MVAPTDRTMELNKMLRLSSSTSFNHLHYSHSFKFINFLLQISYCVLSFRNLVL